MVMNETEFEKHARRAAIAFDLPADVSKEIGRLPHETVQVTYVWFKRENFDLVVSYHAISCTWGFDVTRDEKILECEGWPDDPSVSSGGDCWDFVPIAARGIYLLGFDISPIETHFSLTFSTEEKLEWQREFQRRLREETSQSD
jgi:hypothetical protein